jgi:hypothetical protein
MVSRCLRARWGDAHLGKKTTHWWSLTVLDPIGHFIVDLMDTPDVREKSIMVKRKRRQFTKEFKAEAVRLVLEQK